MKRTALLALVTGLCLALPIAASAQMLNGPGENSSRVAPDGVQVSSGSINSLTTVGNCCFDYSITVVTHAGSPGDIDVFHLEIWDDGSKVRDLYLSAPADGGSHTLGGRVCLDAAPLMGVSGIGVYLTDGPTIASVDPFNGLNGCVRVIPSLSGWGLIALAALLLMAGAVVVTRRQTTLA